MQIRVLLPSRPEAPGREGLSMSQPCYIVATTEEHRHRRKSGRGDHHRGPETPLDSPPHVDLDLDGFRALAVRSNHACGLATVTCWGNDSIGQLDAPEGRFISLTTGGVSCGLREDGAIECWVDSVAAPDGVRVARLPEATAAG